MIKKLQLFKCNVCGNMVEVTLAGGGTLVCCDQPMQFMEENTTEAATEKHVPVVEKVAAGYLVKVGTVAHPMTEAHYIQWIELIADGKAYYQYLAPNDKPEALFVMDAQNVYARAYCNLHGFWKSK
jgi:superoxide reductase